MKVPRVVAVVGPTGSGKARLARALADRCDAILLSCDSMKVYRRMDVGTAKPPLEERERWRGLFVLRNLNRLGARRCGGRWSWCYRLHRASHARRHIGWVQFNFPALSTAA